MLKALEYSDAQDQRQFQYVSETRDAQIALEDKRLQFFRRLVWIILAIMVAVALALFGFAFFGDVEQRTLVGKIVTPALIAVAGYGIFATVSKALKALSRSNHPTA